MAAPTDTYEFPQYTMIRAHGVFKLGFEIMLENLENPPMKDLDNFLGYCFAWASSLDGHHDSEEHVVFPFLNQKLDFSDEIKAHKVIHEGLDDLLAFIKEARADRNKFDAERMKSMMTSLREPLFDHLDAEVEHLKPEELKVFEEKDLKKMLEDLEKYAVNHGDPFVVVPFIRSHTLPEDKPYWPNLGWFLRAVLIPYVFAKRHSGYWKYSPYGMT